jgi:hypothetical protein
MAESVPRRAAALRKLLRRELVRLDAAGLGVYVHGIAATVRLTEPRTGERASAPAAAALAALRALPDRSGARAALDALARPRR